MWLDRHMWLDRTVGRAVTRVHGVTHRRDQRGAAMVEFALILPLLALLTFGIIEFAVAFNTDSNINQAGRAGGRTAAILSTDPQMAFKAGAAAATSLNLQPGTVTGNPSVCIAKFNPAAPQQCDNNQFATKMTMSHPTGPNNPTWVMNNSVGDPPAGPYTIPDNWPVASREFGCPKNGNPGIYDKVIIRVVARHKLLVPGLFSEFFGNDAAPAFTAVAVFQLEPSPHTSC